MQGANKAKKQKLAADEPATNRLATDKPTNFEPTDKPTTNKPATDKPAIKLITLEFTDNLAIIKPNIMEPLGTLRENTC